MPQGIETVVAEDLAEVVFVDAALTGPALGRVFAAGASGDQVQRFSRPRRYVMPVEYARAAGLLDEADDALEDAPQTEAPAAPPKGYDDGEPDMDWSRKAIDEYAAKLTPPLDTTGEDNKRDALAAITDHVKQHPQG